MKNRAANSRTPILDAYSITHIYRPDEPDVERWIDRNEHIIYVNTAAKPGAKIVALV